jgi:hypothetical protein
LGWIAILVGLFLAIDMAVTDYKWDEKRCAKEKLELIEIEDRKEKLLENGNYQEADRVVSKIEDKRVDIRNYCG